LICGIVAYLPNPYLIIEPAKIECMILINSQAVCGEDDFRYRSEKEARISAVKKRIL
jgi:hypothetical protein